MSSVLGTSGTSTSLVTWALSPGFSVVSNVAGVIAACACVNSAVSIRPSSTATHGIVATDLRRVTPVNPPYETAGTAFRHLPTVTSGRWQCQVTPLELRDRLNGQDEAHADDQHCRG